MPTFGQYTQVENFTLNQGDTWTKGFAWFDESNIPLDITTWVFEGEVRHNPLSQGTPIVTVSFVAVDLAGGLNMFAVPWEEMADVPAGDTKFSNKSIYYYDFKVLLPTVEGRVTWLMGQINLNREVSKHA